MLPTTAGVAAMKAFPSPAARADTRHLVDAEHLAPDWPLVGCVSIPGHPAFFGRATADTFLDDARAALNAVREQTFRVSVPLRSLGSAYGMTKPRHLSPMMPSAVLCAQRCPRPVFATTTPLPADRLMKPAQVCLDGHRR